MKGVRNLYNLNRLDIFQELSLNELKEYDFSKAEKIISEHYISFDKFCNYIKNDIINISDIKKVSCTLLDGKIMFFVELTTNKILMKEFPNN